MNKQLTSDYVFIQQFNTVAAEVYKDRKYHYLTNKDIADYRKVDVMIVKDLYSQAKQLLKNREQAWLSGLSTRAKMAIIASNRYGDFKSLYFDVMNEKVDLEDLPKVGHQVATEIRRWCVSHV